MNIVDYACDIVQSFVECLIRYKIGIQVIANIGSPREQEFKSFIGKIGSEAKKGGRGGIFQMISVIWCYLPIPIAVDIQSFNRNAI